MSKNYRIYFVGGSFIDAALSDGSEKFLDRSLPVKTVNGLIQSINDKKVVIIDSLNCGVVPVNAQHISYFSPIKDYSRVPPPTPAPVDQVELHSF
jgi:hypothetical protein